MLDIYYLSSCFFPWSARTLQATMISDFETTDRLTGIARKTSDCLPNISASHMSTTMGAYKNS